MYDVLSIRDIANLQREIRAINLLPLKTEESRKEAWGLLVGSLPFGNAERFLHLDNESIKILLELTPKLRCWYVPIFTEIYFPTLIKRPPATKRKEFLSFRNLFAHYYWGFFSRIQFDYRPFAPVILGITQKENEYITALLNYGLSMASIVDQTFTGHFRLSLPSLVSVSRYESLSTIDKFLFGMDTIDYKVKEQEP